jgi:hypothetical protein
MHAPGSVRRGVEIFADICEAIGAKVEIFADSEEIGGKVDDDRVGWAQFVFNQATSAANAAAANKGWQPPLGFKSDNIENAEKLRRWIDAGIGSDGEGGVIGQANAYLLWMDMPRSDDPEPKERGDLLHDGARFWQLYERRNSFLATLKELRERCNQIIEREPGVHKNMAYVQRMAAGYSRTLMELCGLEVVYTNPNSVYCTVASLLYEGLTGVQGQDLERACEAVARKPLIGTENA